MLGDLSSTLREVLKEHGTSPYRAALEILRSTHGRDLDRASRGEAPLTPSQLDKILDGLDIRGQQAGWDLKWANMQTRGVVAGRAPHPAPDLVGLGALNFDHIVEHRPALGSKVKSRQHWERVAETENVIDDAIEDQSLGLHMKHALGGSSFNVIRLLTDPALALRVGFIGVSGSRPEICVPDLDETHYGQLDSHGVDVRFVARHSDTGGRCLSVVEPAGPRRVARRMTTWPGANRHLYGHLVDNYAEIVAYLASSSFVHVTSVFDRDTTAVIAQLLTDATNVNQGLRVAFDPGDAWSAQRTREIRLILAKTSLLFVNRTELEHMARSHGARENGATSAAQAMGLLNRMRLDKHEPAVVVVKDGAHVDTFSRDEKMTNAWPRRRVEPLSPREIRDDTGAGDTFAAGYIAMRISEPLQAQVGAYLGIHLARLKLASVGGLDASAVVSTANALLDDR